MLALNRELLEKFEDMFILRQAVVADDKIQRFIKYLHLPVKISTHQDVKYQNPQIAKQGRNLFNIVNKSDNTELVKATKLKLMLGTSNRSTGYVETDIMNDKLSPNFSSTYKAGESRAQAREHIKSLLEDATNIDIYDRYLSSVDINNNYDVWRRKNLNLLKNILPQKSIIINVYCEYNWNISRKQDLKNYCTSWSINKHPWSNSIHDRYIITDKVEILLSSGLSNLDDNSNKDFSYIVSLM